MAYGIALSEMSAEMMEDDFVYVSVDLNGLKQTNDTQGHSAGDELINGASRCLCEVFEKYGKVYRIGGDEFACIVPDFENDDDKRIIDAITQKLAEFNCTKQKPYLITISAGTSVFYPQCDLSISDALSQVDERMYEVKKLRKKEIDNRM